MRMQSVVVTLLSAAIGIMLPLALMAIDSMSDHGWWPGWILFFWPSSYILGATAGTKDLNAYLMIAIAVAINGIIYGYVGSLLYRLRRPG